MTLRNKTPAHPSLTHFALRVQVTVILYLNPSWEPSHAGNLRIWPPEPLDDSGAEVAAGEGLQWSTDDAGQGAGRGAAWRPSRGVLERRVGPRDAAVCLQGPLRQHGLVPVSAVTGTGAGTRSLTPSLRGHSSAPGGHSTPSQRPRALADQPARPARRPHPRTISASLAVSAAAARITPAASRSSRWPWRLESGSWCWCAFAGSRTSQRPARA